MDLFGPVYVKSLNKKQYCLVVTDDYSRFTWVFFLGSKDETTEILKEFITRVENLMDHKVKIIRCDNGTEFKNQTMNQFCVGKGIVRQYSVARTPQQNGVAERRNRTLIEAARTMLSDSKLPIPFWAEAVNTACYVQNRSKIVKPHNKTPYELFHGKKPLIDFFKPFGCPITILNTKDQLGKFDEKADVGFFVGYSVISKAYRVYNKRTKFVEENLHVEFDEGKSNSAGTGPEWLFNIDMLTKTMNYVPVSVLDTNPVAGDQSSNSAAEDAVSKNEFVLIEKLKVGSSQDDVVQDSAPVDDEVVHGEPKDADAVESLMETTSGSSLPDSTASKHSAADDSTPPSLTEIYADTDDESLDPSIFGAAADITNLESNIPVSPTKSTRIHKAHP